MTGDWEMAYSPQANQLQIVRRKPDTETPISYLISPIYSTLLSVE